VIHNNGKEPTLTGRDAWDALGHRDAVTRGVEQLIQRKARDPAAFDDATKI
jgi:hypothetical protein